MTTNPNEDTSDVTFREVAADGVDDSSLGSMLAGSAVAAAAAYTRVVGAVVGAGWRRTVESPAGQVVGNMISGAVDAAVRESAPLRAAAGQWTQEQLSRLSAALAPIIMDSIDVDSIAARVDSERVARQVGASIADHIDLNAILADLDIDEVLERVDIEALVDRVDVEAITRRIRIGALVVESTGEAAGTAIDAARRQAIGTNEALLRSMSRLLGRSSDEEVEEDDVGEDVGIDLEEVDSVEEVDSA